MTEEPKPKPKRSRPLFKMGSIRSTSNFMATVDARCRLECLLALARHAAGDWGDLSPDDVAANNAALTNGGRLLSEYKAGDGVVFWIITEADRSATTFLLPEDY